MRSRRVFVSEKSLSRGLFVFSIVDNISWEDVNDDVTVVIQLHIFLFVSSWPIFI